MNDDPLPFVAGTYGAYDSADLDMFRAVLQNVIAKLQASGSPLVEPEALELTRVQIAAAIFQLADSGVRSPERLEELVGERLASGQDAPNMLYIRPSRPTRH